MFNRFIEEKGMHCLEVIVKRNAAAVEAYYARLEALEKREDTEARKHPVHPPLVFPGRPWCIWDVGD